MLKAAYISTLVIALTMGLLGCSRTRTDAEVEGEIQNKINSDAAIASKEITVAANDGVVTLSGTVASDAERNAASADASQVIGVKTVLNNLQLAPSATSSATAQPKPQQRAKGKLSPSTHKSAMPTGTPAGNSSRAQAVPAVTIPEGTILSIRLVDAIDSEKNKSGDTFAATLDVPLVADGRVIAPKNADIEGKIQDVKSAGHFAGRSELALVLTKLTVNGKSYQLSTEEYTQAGSSRGKRTAATVGGGAAVGALIGGLTGGGKGALIGAGAGAGAGTGIQAVTKGQQIQLASESLLEFRLSAPLTVR
jgi:hypothetical protein